MTLNTTEFSFSCRDFHKTCNNAVIVVAYLTGTAACLLPFLIWADLIDPRALSCFLKTSSTLQSRKTAFRHEQDLQKCTTHFANNVEVPDDCT